MNREPFLSRREMRDAQKQAAANGASSTRRESRDPQNQRNSNFPQTRRELRDAQRQGNSNLPPDPRRFTEPRRDPRFVNSNRIEPRNSFPTRPQASSPDLIFNDLANQDFPLLGTPSSYRDQPLGSNPIPSSFGNPYASNVPPPVGRSEVGNYYLPGDPSRPQTSASSRSHLFDLSSSLHSEPKTASIIIDNFQPLKSLSIAISETGQMLRTGSIELPGLNAQTGEISMIMDAEKVDQAITQDSIAGYVSHISPVRASGVVNSAGKIGIVPSKSPKGQRAGQIALTFSLITIAIGGLALAAYMFGFLNFK